MADSENSQAQDDSDEDIYKDFPVFNFEDELAKLEGSKETYKQEALDLSEKLKLLTEENKELKKSNEVLKRNLSSLLKTAQAEVKRKDSMIEQLRNEVESLTFRRNKKVTKEKFTSTDGLEIQTEVKGDLKECKCNDNRSKSYENRTSSVSDYKGNEEVEKKRLGDEKNCDSDSRSGYYGESRRYSKKHHSNEGRYSRGHPEYGDKKRYSSSQDTYQGRINSKEGKSCTENDKRRSQRKDSTDKHRKRSPERKRSRHKEESPEKRKSRHREDSPDKRKSSYREESPDKRSSRHKEGGNERQRRNRKEDSPDRRRRDDRKTDSRREGSSSSIQSRGSKDSSSDKPNKDSVNKNKDTSTHLRETDSIRNSSKGEEIKKQTGGSDKEKTQVDSIKNNTSKDKHSSKGDKKSNLQTFDAKSPLDALYNEMVTTKSHNRFSNPKSGIPRQESKPEVLEQEEMPEQEDWSLSFKNERPNISKPMTLYTKRMLQKFANETKATKNEEEVTKEVITEAVVEYEKEPGELTDDENIVESSKEFQELTKVASIENMINETPKMKIPKEFAKDELLEEPTRIEVLKKETPVEFQRPADVVVPVRGDAVGQKDTESGRELRDAIEFSPFKNNYKLIEISPIKPPGPEHILDFYKKRLPSSGQTQKEVETSIFNLLSSLSGIPIDKKAEEKNEPKILKTSEVKPQEGETKPVEKTENDMKEKPEGKNKDPKIKTRKNTTRKGKTRDKPSEEGKEKEEDKQKEAKPEETNPEEITPGETTQFLDFFLLTTSPSKPIVPEQPDKSGEKSESEGNATKTSETSEEKDSSIEIDSKQQTVDLNIKPAQEPESESLKKEETTPKAEEENNSEKRKRRISTRKENDAQTDDKSQKRKRMSSECDSGVSESKKPKTELSRKRTRSKQNSKNEPESKPESEKNEKEDISTFEFFKPITKKDPKETPIKEESSICSTTDFKMTTSMSVRGVVCLETPDKRGDKVQNLVINEQTIYHVMDSKTNPTFSPLVGSKLMEMTPRRMLKNDLMLTDSEDDSRVKTNAREEEDEEDGELSESENSECYSDSGASDFVDLL